MLRESGGKSDAVAIDELAGFLHLQVARACRRAKEALAEARSFFIGPIDQPHNVRQPITEIRLQPPENLQSGDGIQAAIQPPAVRHGIDMATDEQRPLRYAA
jgi:hypothetical protein